MSSGTQLRIWTAAVLIPAVVAAVWWGPTWLIAAAAGIVCVLSLLEFFAMGQHLGIRAYRLWTCLAALGIVAQQWYAAREAAVSRLGDALFRSGAPRVSLELVLVLFIMGAAAIALGSRRALAEVFTSVSVSAASLVVIVIPLSAVIRLHAVDTSGKGSAFALNAPMDAWSAPHLGRQLLLFTLVVVWVGDSAAYFAGRAIGRFKLSPELSPNKTWEGAGANLFGALLVAVLFGRWMNIQQVHMLAMAALASIAGQVGDIFESAFKRSAGVKDSGTMIPGHGGILDRIDALILAAPAVWYYFQWFVMRRL
jgi:phosphatidate cytidylyltransferase